ncbi:MAG: dipeptidase [Bacteroidales bacterium]
MKFQSFSRFIILLSLLPLVACTDSEEKIIQKAASIHQEVLTLDSHTDTPLMMMRSGFDISQQNDPADRGGKIDFPRMKQGGLDAAFFAVFLGQGPLNPEAYQTAEKRTLDIFSTLHEALEANQDVASLALTADDAYRLQQEEKSAVYIGLENGYPIGLDITRVEKFYDLGARYITLSHTRNNQICDSSTDPEGELHGGLSDFGRQVVAEMNRLGIMIDVSHISDKAFYQVLETSTTPVIASHSNARAICDHNRNLDDDMLLALAENDGVIQICVLGSYVKEMEPNAERDQAFADLRARNNDFQDLSDEQMNKVREQWMEIDQTYPAPLATVADLVDHIDHIVNLIGIDYVGIGTDFDGGGALEDLYDVTQMGNITLELVRRGYSKEDIEKIWAGNFMRVFRAVEQAREPLMANNK